MSKRIGLCMIVKNESSIIRRCLRAALPLMDELLIVDTGSSDDTITEIERWRRENGLEGCVLSEPWRDFAYNRSHALERMRERASVDYVLMIDADDEIVFSDDFDPSAFKASLSADVYDVWTKLGGYAYTRPQLFSNRKPFAFRGVLHEFLDCSTGFIRAEASGFHCLSRPEGARSRDPDKYRRDAELLAGALEAETDPFVRSRYTFYLAQSHRDHGDHARAFEAYRQRAGQGFWAEEVHVSLYEAGRMAEALNAPSGEALDFYLRAFEICPWRAEPLHAAARLCRGQQRFQSARLFARQGLEISRPASGLFLADWIYAYGLRDELAVAAYWCGDYAACLRLCQEILSLPDLPDADRRRIDENARQARVALAAGV